MAFHTMFQAPPSTYLKVIKEHMRTDVTIPTSVVSYQY